MGCPTKLQQTFLGWLDAQGASLARRVLIDEVQNDHLTFHLHVGFPALTGGLSERELVVAIMDGDETLDLLVSLDALLVQDGDRWPYSICRNEGKDESSKTGEAL